MSHRRALKFTKTACPICGSREVARDDHKGDMLCTNCGHIIVREETKSVGKFEIAQALKREGKMDFEKLKQATQASDASLYNVVQNMENMGLLQNLMGNYSLTKKGQRWYRQRLGQEWGY
ncbi:MAG: TFIIB-type zinc ribbon-containing protein [Candidatus Thorarchaeota archaeon]|nr:TFIIB-type zinc ribbon-containing protein [Candidatus Thorarchaeota archaeon]